MSNRRDAAPVVVTSVENNEADRCVDLIEQADGTYVFKECRRDPEDGGRWTLIADYSDTRHATQADALRAAALRIPWLAAR